MNLAVFIFRAERRNLQQLTQKVKKASTDAFFFYGHVVTGFPQVQSV